MQLQHSVDAECRMLNAERMANVEQRPVVIRGLLDVRHANCRRPALVQDVRHAGIAERRSAELAQFARI